MKVPRPAGRPVAPAAVSAPRWWRLARWAAVLWLIAVVVRYTEVVWAPAGWGQAFRFTLGGPYDRSDAAAAWLAHLRGALVAAAVVAVAWSWGPPVLRWLRTRRAPATAAGGAGFVVFGLAVFGLGTVGLLAPACLAALAAVAARDLAGLPGRLRRGAAVLRPGGFAARLAAVGAGIVCALAFVPALAPELGWDPLTYHLRVPSLWLAARKVFSIPFSLGSFYPFLAEQWLVPAMAFGGDEAAKLVNYAFLPMTVLALAETGLAAGAAAAGWIAALVYAAIPVGVALAGQCYNDLEEAWFALLAVRAALRAGPAWRLCCAVLLGGAMGVKYVGAFPSIACGLLWLARERAGGVRRTVRGAVVPTAAALALFAPWPLRDWLWTGNPVFPMLSRLFPDAGWNPYYTAAEAARILPGRVPRGVLPFLAELLRFPWDASTTYFTISVNFSPLIFGLLPGFVAPGPAARRFAGLAAGGGALSVCYVLSGGGDGRYLMPTLAVLAAPAAEGLLRLAAAPVAGGLATVAVAASLVVQAAHWAGFESRNYAPWRVAAGLEPRAVYLARAMLPNWEYHPFAVRANGALPLRARVLLGSDIVGHYLDRYTVIDTQQVMPPIVVRWAAECRDPAALRKRFRQLGIGWVYHSSRLLAFERDCRCFKIEGAARTGWRAFWRRYAEPAFEYGSLKMFRLRSEAEAARRPPPPFIAFPGVVEAVLAEAEAAQNAKEPARAEAAFRRLVREEPELAAARFHLAEWLLLAHRHPEAEREAEAARKLGLDSGQLWMMEANLRMSRGDAKGGIEAARAGVARWPGPRPHALYAAVAWAARRPEEARRALAVALRQNPWDPEVKRIAANIR